MDGAHLFVDSFGGLIPVEHDPVDCSVPSKGRDDGRRRERSREGTARKAGVREASASINGGKRRPLLVAVPVHPWQLLLLANLAEIPE